MDRKFLRSIHLYSRSLSVLWLLILLLGTACVLNNSDNPVPIQTSIPIETAQTSVAPNPILSEHLWVLSSVTYRGEDMGVDALYPTYFRFDRERGSLLITTPCEGTDNFIRGIGYGIVFQDEQHYMLSPQEMITVDCGEMIDAQSENLKVLDTSQYEIQEDKLILSGENIQIVLEKDNSNP